jgi:hypothetical protein
METKICNNCNNSFYLKDFKICKTSKDGYTNQCKVCINVKRKEYRKNSEKYKKETKNYILKNKEKINEYYKYYSKNNKEKINKIKNKYASNNEEKVRLSKLNWLQNNTEKRKIIANNSAKKNKEKTLIYQKNKRKNDVNYKIKCNLRNRLYKSLKNTNAKKYNSFLQLIGCSSSFLKEYLQNKFVPTMTWDNYGLYWHIDHIKPCSLFDLSIEEEQKKCFHYSNLQPLFAVTQIIDNILYVGNINKNNKYL